MVRRSWRTGALIIGVLALAWVWRGCASGGVDDDPMLVVRNPREPEADRMRAVDEVWARVLRGEADRKAVREDLKTLAWSPNWPEALRVHTLTHLLNDPDPVGAADAREMARLMLPREQRLAVIRVLSETAAARGWTEMLPALVRSLSRFDAGTPDAERPEYRAIGVMCPERPVAATVLEVFRNPPAEQPGYGASTPERIRADAWDVLARLDPAGDLRASMIVGETAGPGEADDGMLASLRACLHDLHTLPRAGEELKWLSALRHTGGPRNAAWWAEATAAIQPLYDDRGRMLDLRHAEPIRWAERRRPEWVSAPRRDLLAELERRMEGRTVPRRTARDRIDEPIPAQTLAEVRDRLNWGDLLTLLVVDEAVREPVVVQTLFAQADMDREDRSAEYGGLLEAWRDGAGRAASASDGTAPFRVVLYPPRPGMRRGDREFVASPDMIEQGDLALAHYHFHAQQAGNSDYAGPAPADTAYAARMGRTCLVFTSITRSTLNVDLYQPDGTIVDLGDIRRP